jgi:hypothetical protein
MSARKKKFLAASMHLTIIKQSMWLSVTYLRSQPKLGAGQAASLDEHRLQTDLKTEGKYFAAGDFPRSKGVHAFWRNSQAPTLI